MESSILLLMLLALINSVSPTSEISSQCQVTLNSFSKCQSKSALAYKKSHPSAQISIVNSIPIYCPMCSSQYNDIESVCDTELANGSPMVFMQYFTCYSINSAYCMTEFQSVKNSTVIYEPFDCSNPCQKFLANYFIKFNSTLTKSAVTPGLSDAGWTVDNIKKCVGVVDASKTNFKLGSSNQNSFNMVLLVILFMY